MNRCVFLDRDGVLNKELGYQITDIEDFELVNGLKDSISKLKSAGFFFGHCNQSKWHCQRIL